MSKRLYLMRHGETLFNKLGRIQGACDSPLTDDGIRQAKMAKQYYKELFSLDVLLQHKRELVTR